MLISVIIPAHNRAALLPQALNSVLEQSWRPVEIIVVDNGSTDTTASVAREFGAAHSAEDFRVEVISEAVPSPTRARNTGVRRSGGEAILFLDSDDVLTSDGLNQLGKALSRKSSVDFVYGQVAIAGSDLIVKNDFKVGAPAADLLSDTVAYDWHTMAALYRKELVLNAGGWDETTRGADDWVFQARIKRAARTYDYIDVVVGIWRQHHGERLGTAEFRVGYTSDVVDACVAIFKLAGRDGAINKRTQRRLALRCLRHAWELGRFGAKVERVIALDKLAVIASDSKRLRLMTGIARRTPTIIEVLLHRLIDRRNMVPKMGVS